MDMKIFSRQELGLENLNPAGHGLWTPSLLEQVTRHAYDGAGGSMLYRPAAMPRPQMPIWVASGPGYESFRMAFLQLALGFIHESSGFRLKYPEIG